MTSYLVTGGCGFIGSHLAEALASRPGVRIVIFDNLSSGRIENLASFRDRVEFIEGDIRDRAALEAAMEGIDCVFHEAALVSVFESVQRPDANHEINVTGTLNVLLAARARKVKRVVQASSAAVYGNNPQIPKREEMRPEPASPYAAAKIMAEYQGRIFTELYGLPVVSLRYFNVFGPRQDPSSPYSGVISRFADAVASGKNPTIFGDGRQTRDFVFVRDVVRANLLAMNEDRVPGGAVLNIATGRATNLLDLLAAINRVRRTSVEPLFEAARAGDVRDSLADPSAARQTLGFESSFTLERGLAETMGLAGESHG